MMKTQAVNGYTVEMDWVAGGMFCQVRVLRADGSRDYSNSHMSSTQAEIDFLQKVAEYVAKPIGVPA